MQVYGITITCSQCDSENIDYEQNEQTLTARNGRGSWSHIRCKCVCENCGHQFEEVFSLQRSSIDIN